MLLATLIFFVCASCGLSFRGYFFRKTYRSALAIYQPPVNDAFEFGEYVNIPYTEMEGNDNESFVNRGGPWDEKDLDSLLAANKRWASRIAVTNPSYFDINKRGHNPKILWIGCRYFS